MNWAARLVGSISVSAARQRRSYSSLRQRVRFAPDHLFAFCATSHEQNARMNACGSGCRKILLESWRSAKKWLSVSTLAGSEEKYTDPTTDFSSHSMPARPHACLTIDCTFCRIGWLTA